MSFKDLATKENSLKTSNGKEKFAVAPTAPTTPATANTQRPEETKS